MTIIYILALGLIVMTLVVIGIMPMLASGMRDDAVQIDENE